MSEATKNTASKATPSKAPAGAKKPQDRKPASKPGVTIVKANGKTYEISDEARNDFEVMDYLARSEQEQNPMYMPTVLRKLLGEEGYRAALDDLRGENGRVTVDAGLEFISTVLEQLDPN